MKKEIARQIIRNLSEAKKIGPKEHSFANISTMEGKLKDLAEHIEYLKGVHKDWSERHEKAKEDHENGRFDEVAQNHWTHGPLGRH